MLLLHTPFWVSAGVQSSVLLACGARPLCNCTYFGSCSYYMAQRRQVRSHSNGRGGDEWAMKW